MEEKADASEAEAAKAARMWDKYLQVDNSPITDLFCGQLQSTVHCHKCGRRFTMYEPFWDLSLPLTREGKGGLGAWLSGKTHPASIMDCMQGFFGDEKLEVGVAICSVLELSPHHGCGGEQLGLLTTLA